MELIGNKVCRLDIGDYYSVIDFGGHRTIYGFSQKSSFLLDDTVKYVRRFGAGTATVFVYCRRVLGLSDELIASLVVEE